MKFTTLKHVVGDFFQLPSIETPLYKAIFTTGKEESVSPISIGARLFQNFLVSELKINVRTQNDPELQRINDQLRDFSKQYPVTSDIVQYLTNRIVTVDDIESPDFPYLSAPIVVTSNNERIGANTVRMERFARDHGIPILRWRNTLSEAIDMMLKSDPSKEMHTFRLFTTELHQYFCQGAPIHLNRNINPVRGLANGTSGLLYGLTFASNVDYEAVMEKVQHAQPGEIIDISPIQPSSVLIELDLPLSEIAKWPAHMTVVPGRVIIPILKDTHPERIKTEKGGIKYYKFGYELAFSFTTFKIQGDTLDAIILQLNKRPRKLAPLLLAHLIVMLSRSKTGIGIRLLPLMGSLEYLQRLQHDFYLKLFYESIDFTTGKISIPSTINVIRPPRKVTTKSVTSSSKPRQSVQPTKVKPRVRTVPQVTAKGNMNSLHSMLMFIMSVFSRTEIGYSNSFS